MSVKSLSLFRNSMFRRETYSTCSTAFDVNSFVTGFTIVIVNGYTWLKCLTDFPGDIGCCHKGLCDIKLYYILNLPCLYLFLLGKEEYFF